MKFQNSLSVITTALALMLSFTQLLSSAAIEKEIRSADLTLKGKVTDAATTQNIADAQIFISQQGISTLSGEKGKFELKNVSSGTYTVEVEAEGYKLWAKEMTLEEDTELTIKLERENKK